LGSIKKIREIPGFFFIGLSAYCRLALANFSAISVSAVPRITLPAGRQAQRIILEVKPP